MEGVNTGVQLEKVQVGGKVNLSKNSTDGGEVLKQVLVGLGWDVNASSEGVDFDADVSIVFTDKEEKAIPGGLLFYNTPKTGGKLLVGDYAEHTGDNLTGEGEGDDEAVILSLDKMPPEIDKAIVYVTIDRAQQRNQNFGMLQNSFIRVANNETQSELAKMELDFDADQATSLRFGTIVRRGTDWYFSAEKIAIDGGLSGICAKHGIATS